MNAIFVSFECKWTIFNSFFIPPVEGYNLYIIINRDRRHMFTLFLRSLVIPMNKKSMYFLHLSIFKHKYIHIRGLHTKRGENQMTE